MAFFSCGGNGKNWHSDQTTPHRGRDDPTPGWDGCTKAPRKEGGGVSRHLGDGRQEINKPLLLRKVKKSRAATFRALRNTKDWRYLRSIDETQTVGQGKKAERRNTSRAETAGEWSWAEIYGPSGNSPLIDHFQLKADLQGQCGIISSGSGGFGIIGKIRARPYI